MPSTFARSVLISRAMLRRLLACLALLTGLAAAGAPAQAAFAQGLAARVEASVSSTPAQQRQARAAIPRPVLERPQFLAIGVSRPVAAEPYRALTVFLRSDRARE